MQIKMLPAIALLASFTSALSSAVYAAPAAVVQGARNPAQAGALQTREGEVIASLKLSPAGGFDAKATQITSDIKRNAVGAPAPYSLTTFKIKVEDLKTGISLRDEHLHKHMNSAANPWIIATNVKLDKTSGTMDLNLNGVTKPVSFQYVATATGVNFNFTVLPTDFKIPEAKYLGVKVKNEVKVVGTLAI